MRQFVELTKQEIIEGLRGAIAAKKQDDKVHFSQLLSDTELPDIITIELVLKPRGSEAGDYPDRFGPGK